MYIITVTLNSTMHRRDASQDWVLAMKGGRHGYIPRCYVTIDEANCPQSNAYVEICKTRFPHNIKYDKTCKYKYVQIYIENIK